jgi:hypothetical protein
MGIRQWIGILYPAFFKALLQKRGGKRGAFAGFSQSRHDSPTTPIILLQITISACN